MTILLRPDHRDVRPLAERQWPLAGGRAACFAIIRFTACFAIICSAVFQEHE